MITLLSLNIWGAPYSKHRSQRTDAIATNIQALDPDIIVLQEVYLPDNRHELINRLSTKWSHYHYFSSSVVGSGLLTLSKYPLRDVAFHRFRLGGKPERLNHGDYYAGKGIGYTLIDTPNGSVAVFNCHTHAQYELGNDNEYAVFNETNLYEAARFIWNHSQQTPTAVCGDLNTRPDQLGYHIIRSLAQLQDAYYAHHGTFPTTFSTQNPYNASKSNQCIDYILTRECRPTDIEISFTERPQNSAPAYSDHYALLASINFEMNHSSSSQNLPVKTTHDTLEELASHIEVACTHLSNQQDSSIERSLLSLSLVLDISILTRFLKRHTPNLAKLMRTAVTLIAIAYAVTQWLHMLLNLRPRKQILEALLNEINIQLKARSAFNGDTW